MHNNSNRCLYSVNLLILLIQLHVPVLVSLQNHKPFTIYTIMSASITVYSKSVIDFFFIFPCTYMMFIPFDIQVVQSK